MSQRRSKKSSQRGYTIMVLGGPGRKPRRLHVPRWALGALLCSWLVMMLVAAWFGFHSLARPTPVPSVVRSNAEGASTAPGAVEPDLQGAVTASTTGVSDVVPASSPVSRHE
jgi:hypothetical protein